MSWLETSIDASKVRGVRTRTGRPSAPMLSAMLGRQGPITAASRGWFIGARWLWVKLSVNFKRWSDFAFVGPGHGKLSRFCRLWTSLFLMFHFHPMRWEKRVVELLWRRMLGDQHPTPGVSGWVRRQGRWIGDVPYRTLWAVFVFAHCNSSVLPKCICPQVYTSPVQ